MRVDQRIVQHFAQFGDVRLPHRLVPAPLHVCDRLFHRSVPCLVGAWINEDVEQLDTPVLNMGDVSPRRGHGAIRRTRAPEQPRGAVVATAGPAAVNTNSGGNRPSKSSTACEIAAHSVATVSGS